jgi:ABC-type xylose transport system substrate-binding protein
MAGHWRARLPHPPYSPGFATADNYLVGRLKQQFSRKTLDSEQNALEMATEILSGLPKDELKTVFLH